MSDAAGTPDSPANDGLSVTDLPILAVDDDPALLRSLKRTIAGQNWQLITSRDASEGLMLLEHQEFAVVLADFKMPGMDGLEFLGRVRDRWPDTERILLTAHADTDILERGVNDASMGRFLRKPWEAEGLLEMIAHALRQSRLRREHGVLWERLRHRNAELSFLNRMLQDRVEASDRAMHGIRRRWDVALNAVSDPVILVGPGLRLESGNRKANELANTETLQGKRCYATLFNRETPCPNCPIGHGASHITARVGDKDITYDARAYPLPGSQAWLCIYNDVTREAAFQRHAMQTEKMAAIGRIVGNVAHELNNPLHGILSFVQLAQRPDVLPDKLHRYHEVIYDCALRCRDIVQELRNFARQPKPDERARVNLLEVCERALVLFPQLESDKLRVSGDKEAVCQGNANSLQQVVVNLVQNALDACPPDGVVDVTVRVEGKEAIVAVEDDGPGVSPDVQDKIFEPFFTTKPEGVGTGLGLAICHTIMRDHHGKLVVSRATTRRGARFEMVLPGPAEVPHA